MIETHESNVVYLEAISSSLWNRANFKSRGLRPSLSNVGRERGNGSYELYQYCYRQNFFQTALDQSDSIRAGRTKSSSNNSLKIASIRRQIQGEEGQNQTQATISNQWNRKKRFPEKRLPRKTTETIKTIRETRKLSHKPSVPPSLGDFLGLARALHLFQVRELLPHGVHEVVEVVLQALGRLDGEGKLCARKSVE